jgi:hypothetical protein
MSGKLFRLWNNVLFEKVKRPILVIRELTFMARRLVARASGLQLLVVRFSL